MSAKFQGRRLEEFEAQYAHSLGSADLRDRMYDRDGRNLKHEGLCALGLNGQETILDAGCGNADTGLYLAVELQHEGKYIGMEPPVKLEMLDEIDREYIQPSTGQEYVSISYDQRFHKALQFKKRHKLQNLKFIHGFLQDIPLKDSSVDAILSYWSMHHVPIEERARAIEQCIRVLKPGGKIAVGANGIEHKVRQHAILKELQIILGTEFGGAFSKKFKLETIPAIVSQHKELEIIGLIPQNGELPITKENLVDYNYSLNTYIASHYPIPTAGEWNHALKHSPTYKKLLKDINDYGASYDLIRRGVVILRKKTEEEPGNDRKNAGMWLPASALESVISLD